MGHPCGCSANSCSSSKNSPASRILLGGDGGSPGSVPSAVCTPLHPRVLAAPPERQQSGLADPSAPPRCPPPTNRSGHRAAARLGRAQAPTGSRGSGARARCSTCKPNRHEASSGCSDTPPCSGETERDEACSAAATASTRRSETDCRSAPASSAHHAPACARRNTGATTESATGCRCSSRVA